MGQASPCLKKLFIFFNLLFAILGGVLIFLAVLSQVVSSNETELEGRTVGLATLYVVGGVTVALAVLGAYGAHKEKRIPLIVFMCILLAGGLILLRVSIPAAVHRPKLETSLEEAFKHIVPLDTASENSIRITEMVQSKLKCCGWFSSRDWRQSIPQSCNCQTQDDQDRGLCERAGYSRFYGTSKMIYKQPCFPIVLKYSSLSSDVALGFLFCFSALALLGALVSGILVHQLRAPPQRPSTVFNAPSFTVPSFNAPSFTVPSFNAPSFTAPSFNASPPKYTELFSSQENQPKTSYPL